MRPIWTGLVIALCSALSAGCLDFSEDGIRFSPRVPYETSVRSVGEPVTWHGEPVVVDVERGFVEVIGDPDATELVVTSHALTWAKYGDIDSARSIQDAILATAFVKVEAGKVRVGCGVIAEDHGSAEAEATQCDLRIVVPAPPQATHQLSVRTGLGDVFLQRLTTSANGKIELNVSGFVQAWELHANVVSSAGAHDLELSPLPGGFVDVSSTVALAGELGTEGASDAKDVVGTTLRMPKTFATTSLVLWSDDGVVTTADFPDLVPGASSRPGADPALLIRAQADWGDVRLFVQDVIVSRSRTSALGTVVTKP